MIADGQPLSASPATTGPVKVETGPAVDVPNGVNGNGTTTGAKVGKKDSSSTEPLNNSSLSNGHQLNSNGSNSTSNGKVHNSMEKDRSDPNQDNNNEGSGSSKAATSSVNESSIDGSGPGSGGASTSRQPATGAAAEGGGSSTSTGSTTTVKKSGHGTSSSGGAKSRTGHPLTAHHHRGSGYGSFSGISQIRGGPQQASYEFPLRILVAPDSVGAIIGKSGGTIKQITQESRARVDVLRKDQGPPHHHHHHSFHHQQQQQQDKEIAIYGPPESCSMACEKILEIIMADGGEQASGSNGGGGASRWANDGRSSGQDDGYDVPLKMLAHNSLVGRIIGKNGATVKKIMESTNTKISVSNSIHDQERNMFAVDRIITIRGSTIADVISAESAISSKLRSSFESDQINMVAHHGAMNPMFPGMLPPMMGPPPSGHHPHHGQGGRGPGFPGGSRAGSIAGPPMGLQPGFVHHGFPPVASGPLGFHGHHLPGLPGFGNPVEEKETAIMFVPQGTVGAIIGTGGATIREMIAQSGANIKVAQPPKERTQSRKGDETSTPAAGGGGDGGEESSSSRRGSESAGVSALSASLLVDHRKVTITGTPEAQWKAQYAIFRKVSYETPNGPITDANLVVEIMVPSSQVGRIIGKSGQTVRELQRMTRAQIKLPEEGSTTGSETPVQITGDFFACQGAQRQIRALVARGLLPGLDSLSAAFSNMSAAGGRPPRSGGQRSNGSSYKSTSRKSESGGGKDLKAKDGSSSDGAADKEADDVSADKSESNDN